MRTASKVIASIILAGSLIGFVAIVLVANRPRDASQSCQEFYAGMENAPAAAVDWCEAGDYFSWGSTLPENADHGALNIFHMCQGNPDNPAVLMIHGYPTSSLDWAALAADLSQDHYVCALDTPGYGFSDKPRGWYKYSIFDDARLVDTYICDIAGLEDFALMTHDKGDSVGLALLQLYQAYAEKPYTIKHHFITNGNIYLPLAQLTTGQRVLLNPTLGPLASRFLRGDRIADSLAESTFATTLPQSEIDAYASTFDYQDGNRVQHDIIKYLNERTENEIAWLETLERSDIPVTIIWGELDSVAPVAVPDYVWEHYLRDRAAPASYRRIPGADHYLQVDESELLADLVRSTLTGAPVSHEITGLDCQHNKMGGCVGVR
jgi:pimeloyl-ACP methyl ester carboxylesterase